MESPIHFYTGGILTQTKQQQALDKMTAFGAFQCPKCDMPLAVQSASLRCPSGHTFDVARKGYVHLYHKTVENSYDKSLFTARRAVFDAGFYLPVVQALKEALATFPFHTLLDAGCGEGYYLSSLSAAFPDALMAGVDLSKEGIVAAAGRDASALYCVADLNHLPFRDGAFDAVLNILSPANYASFCRVMKKDGLFLKVMPGRGYLQEIRDRLKSSKAEYDDTRVPEYLRLHMQILSLRRIEYTLPLSPEAYACFTAMTPLTESLTGDERAALMQNVPDHITIDLQLAVCKTKAAL